MEKLIELLNEYNINVLGCTDKWVLKNSIDNPGTKYISLSSVGGWKIYLWIISKEYEFIKWLVDNDKIDTQNLITYMNGTSLTFNKVPSTDCTNIDKTWNNFYTECLLMLLSIQDNPIEFLISILK